MLSALDTRLVISLSRCNMSGGKVLPTKNVENSISNSFILSSAFSAASSILSNILSHI